MHVKAFTRVLTDFAAQLAMIDTKAAEAQQLVLKSLERTEPKKEV